MLKLNPVATRAAKRASIFGIPIEPLVFNTVAQEQGKKKVNIR